MSLPKNEQSKMGSSEDAIERFQRWKDKDPYPDIYPALLNSADIHDYIQTTGMVYPYDPGLMKSSSYEARIGDHAYYWDENGDRKDITLGDSLTVQLAPNSLVFFETKEEFRLPSYMAIRFNLRITNVHRGLLLGTGPLVDPGFEGKLLIPIHNLTNNSYHFSGGEAFIWIEFTKISENEIWSQDSKDAECRHGVYESFPTKKKNLKPPAYFEKANRGNSIQNAVPEALVEVEKIAGAAREISEKARDKLNIITVGGVLAVLVAVIGFYPLITDSVNLSKDVSKTISEFQHNYQDHLAKETSSQAQIEALIGEVSDIKLANQNRGIIPGQQKQIDDLEKKVEALKNELDRYKAQLAPPSPSRQ